MPDKPMDVDFIIIVDINIMSQMEWLLLMQVTDFQLVCVWCCVNVFVTQQQILQFGGE